MTKVAINRMFLYGTLMPGRPRWPILSGYVVGVPVCASATGTLFDTGFGFPAMFPGTDPVPGFLVHLDSVTLKDALGVLDDVEAVGSGLFRREQVPCQGELAWVYLGQARWLRRVPIASWLSRDGQAPR